MNDRNPPDALVFGRLRLSSFAASGRNSPLGANEAVKRLTGDIQLLGVDLTSLIF
jgi:hypothetical protein